MPQNRVNRSTRIFGSLTVLALLMFLVGCVQQTQQTPVAPDSSKPKVLRKLVATVPTLSASQWDYYVATAKGYFAEEGLEVERVIAESNTKSVQALVAGSVDIASGSPDAALRAMAGGANLVVIGANTLKPVYSLISTPDITEWSQLKGKRVGVSALASMDAVFMQKLLDNHGLKKGDYQMVEVGGTAARFAALESKAIAAGLLNQPEDFKAMRVGLNRLGVSSEVSGDVTWSAFTVRKEWAAANEDVLVRFMSAIRKAHLYMWDPKNKVEVSQYLAKETNTAQEDAEQTYDLWTRENALSKEGEVTLQGMTQMVEALKEQKLLSGDLVPAETFDLKYLEMARKK